MKLVLDTNVIVSAVFHGGVPLEIVRAASAGRIELCVTADIVAEYREVLLRFFGPGSESDVAIVLDGLLENALVVAPVLLISQLSTDPDDDMFVACALAAQADLIVSGDKHLLALNGRIAIPVARPREALSRFG